LAEATRVEEAIFGDEQKKENSGRKDIGREGPSNLQGDK
jgi:hypothetical protein